MIGRELFWLFCPLTIAQLHSLAAAVLVDELDAGYFPSRRPLLASLARKMKLGSF
jgi:hypothetical protein